MLRYPPECKDHQDLHNDDRHVKLAHTWEYRRLWRCNLQQTLSCPLVRKNLHTDIGSLNLMDTKTPRLPIGKLLLGIVAVIAFAGLGRQFGIFLEGFATWVSGLGPFGPIAFIAGYVAATVAFIPGSVLTLVGGVLFGLVQGTLFALIGATIGATLSFLIARYLAREAVEYRLADNPKFAAIDRAIEQQGRKIVLLLRLSPIVPFNLLNYGLGLTNVRLVDYITASIGMLPGTVLYAYSGLVIGDVARLAGGVSPARGLAYYAFVGVGLLATVLVVMIVARTSQKAIAELTKN